jgi:hypothetical protein
VLLIALVAAAVWFRSDRPADQRDSVPTALYDEWYAEDGPHAGSRLLLSRSQVALANASETLESGTLLGIFTLPSDGGFLRYRIEYGDELAPGSLIVMLDGAGNLRLANHPTSKWIAEMPESHRQP